MIEFLLVVVLIGVPLALFVTRRRLAQLGDRRIFLAVVGVAWVLVIGVLARAADTNAMQNQARERADDAKADVDTGEFRAAGSESGTGDGVAVHRVLSGDTLILADARRVRVLGIDAPDRGEPCFAESRDELTRLIGSSPVTLTADPSRPDIDPSGYLLRYVEETYLVDGDVSVQQARAGMAHYDAGESRLHHATDIREAQTRASEREIGLWADPPCGSESSEAEESSPTTEPEPEPSPKPQPQPEPKPAPKPDPDPEPAPRPAPNPSDDDSGGSAYYPNCDAARAAGAAPLYAGEPGYSRKLDRDGDGVACE